MTGYKTLERIADSSCALSTTGTLATISLARTLLEPRLLIDLCWLYNRLKTFYRLERDYIPSLAHQLVIREVITVAIDAGP